jgi:hypothetical protein
VRRVAFVLFGIAAALLVAVVVLVSSQSHNPQRPLTVVSAKTADGSTLVNLALDSCHTRLLGSVDDGPDEVRVTVSSSSPDTHPPCSNFMVVKLQAPLAARPLIDTSTGAVVAVQVVSLSDVLPTGGKLRLRR